MNEENCSNDNLNSINEKNNDNTNKNKFNF